MESKLSCNSMEDSIRLRKGAWAAWEDNLLRKCIQKYGEGKWHQVPERAGLNRCRKSCRLRWLNYLRPNIKRGSFSVDEVDLMIRMHKLLGNRWSLIAGRLPGRTANDVKNYWNTHLSKKENSSQNKNIEVTEKVKAMKSQPRSFTKNFIWVEGKGHLISRPSTTLEENMCKPESDAPLPDEGVKWWETLLSEFENEMEQEGSMVGDVENNTCSTSTGFPFDTDLWNFYGSTIPQN